MFLSPHPAPLQGPLMSPLPRWCLTELMQSRMRWQIWQRNRLQWGPLPSRDGNNYWQYYLQLWTVLGAVLIKHYASVSYGLLGFPLTPPCVLQFILQLLSYYSVYIICNIHAYRFKYSSEEYAVSYALFLLLKNPPQSSGLIACCYTENDFEFSKHKAISLKHCLL